MNSSPVVCIKVLDHVEGGNAPQGAEDADELLVGSPPSNDTVSDTVTINPGNFISMPEPMVHGLPSIHIGDYVDMPEPPARGRGGRPGDRRLLALAIRCYRIDDPDKTNVFRCAGTDSGCRTAWKTKNRVKQRILNHAVSCEHLPRALKEELDGGLAMSAPSAQLFTKVAVMPKQGKSSRTAPKTILESNQPSVYPLAKKARADKLTAQLDADVVQFFCVGGIPPSKASLPEWKQIFQHAAPTYQPASASKLEEYHIPSEAALVRTQQLEHLRTCTNLCITFDGQKIRLPQSVYTIHIITPERRICCFDGHEASEDSHTGEHLFKMLDEVSPTDLLHDSQLCQSRAIDR